MPRPNKRSALASLGKKRLVELNRLFDIGTKQPEPKAAFIEGLAHSKAASFRKLLDELTGAELKKICRDHELAVSGSKAELVARILGEDLSEESEPEPGLGEGKTQLALELDAFRARAQPSVQAIVPMLTWDELKPVVRRLAEAELLELDVSKLAPGLESLAAAISEQVELPQLLAELDRKQLSKVSKRYALTPESRSREDYVRAILADAAGITIEEAKAAEARQLDAGEPEPEPKPDQKPEPREKSPAAPDGPKPESAPEPKPSADVEAYTETLQSLPRGLLHRIDAEPTRGEVPEVGEIIRARHRQYLVSEVVHPQDPSARRGKAQLKEATLLKLVCLDDDAQGRELEIVWELELGVERVDPTRQGLGGEPGFDAPSAFSAYLHALQWNCVTTATKPEDERVQAPFRAGVVTMQHQMVPLLKALALPRVNLFIADDVGLGKTIEAGLIMQELLLRQRLELILIACPASICLQWQAEMERRFGLRFEIMNREHMARLRRERGAGTNPWTCGRRFVVSYQTLRRPEYQESLRNMLGQRAPKSMLILDEAHTVAPASNQQRYAVDSQLTKLARSIAPAFENRLFLSATPHNGHSNSFSALLELLDPIRFTRGVPVEGRDQLDAVMVRRLKRDLEGYTTLEFPKRKLVELSLRRDDTWALTRRVRNEGDQSPRPLPDTQPSHELELSELLARYTDLCSPSAKRDRQVFIGLQKRLLSSTAAFERTLEVHLRRTGQRILEELEKSEAEDTEQLDPLFLDAQAATDDGETTSTELDEGVIEQVSRPTKIPDSAHAEAVQVVERMAQLSRGSSRRPEAKILALVDWIRQNQCPAAGAVWFDGQEPGKTKHATAWTNTRLIIFTEYADTASYIIKMLRGALAGTERADDRVAYFHGAMSDDGRRELQASFNADPNVDPVRILVATDAAREGVNLQAHCADLLHYDIPWNPGRLEQRNGRIDRALQKSPEVRCMYFAYPQRAEDRVLQVVVEKVDRIQRELGSLSAVVLERIEDALEPHGIDDKSQQRLLIASEGGAEESETVTAEIEAVRADVKELRAEIDRAADCYERSRAFFSPDADGLRTTVEKALELAGAERGFEQHRGPKPDPEDPQLYTLPELPPEWSRTLDTLRSPKPKDLGWWEWRQKHAPRPVVFRPLKRVGDDVVQLHLEHPVVRRALRRFTAQGYAAHDLHRAAMVRYEGSRERVVLVGRLSLFGTGATRLHDALLHAVADVREGEPAQLLSTGVDKVLDQMREALHRSSLDWAPNAELEKSRLGRQQADIAALWPTLAQSAHDEAEELVRLLDDRGAREAEELERILDEQTKKIQAALVRLDAPESEASTESAVNRQMRLDKAHMQDRLRSLQAEREREPALLREHYHVLTRRVQAVGLVYLIPESR